MLALYPRIPELVEDFKPCSEGCLLCSSYVRGESEWPRQKRCRMAGSDGIKTEALQDVRPPRCPAFSDDEEDDGGEDDSGDEQPFDNADSEGGGGGEGAGAEAKKPPSPLLEYRREMSSAIAAILNLYFTNPPKGGGFRDILITLLKKASVAGRRFNPEDPSCYRPISCGNTLPNLLQTIMATRLKHWLMAEEVLEPEQGGFTPQMNCEQLVLLLIETIKMKTSEGKFLGNLYLDISSAFDDVFLELMFAILRNAGAGEKFCNLFSEWFGDRTISIKGDTATHKCDKGLPQGSPIAPLLWNIIFDTLLKRLKERVPGVTIKRVRKGGKPDDAVTFILKLLAYADDLVILVEGSSIEEVRRKLQEALDVIAEWAREFSFRVNTGAGKTEAMIFPPRLQVAVPTVPTAAAAAKPRRGNPPQILFADLVDVDPLTMLSGTGVTQLVRFVTEYKYLGVWILWNLNMNKFRLAVLEKFCREIRRHFIYDPITKLMSWAAQSQIFNSLCIGQLNYMLSIILPNRYFYNMVESMARQGTKELFGARYGVDNILLDVEASGSPAEGLVAQHQVRAYKSFQHIYRKDAPIHALMAVQRQTTSLSFYVPRMEALLRRITTEKVSRGLGAANTKRGVLSDESSIKAVKQSVKELRFTYSRALVFEGREGANTNSARLLEKHRVEALKRCLELPATPQLDCFKALYCVGIGTPPEHCIHSPGVARFSMPGPGSPSWISSCGRRINVGSLQLLARTGRGLFLAAVFLPRRKAGYKLKSKIHKKMRTKEICPLCLKEGSDDGIFHLIFLCTHADLAALQRLLREQAADVLVKVCMALVAGAKIRTKLTQEEKEALTASLKAVKTLCEKGALKENNQDANNVIFRMMVMVPFPEKLADYPGVDLPLIRAFGRLCDQLGATRCSIKASAGLMASWSTGWFLKFARARMAILPKDYYLEPAPKEEGEKVATTHPDEGSSTDSDGEWPELEAAAHDEEREAETDPAQQEPEIGVVGLEDIFGSE
jgi:Reverse transcriptase (RNA-dependent DNA polymerase)